MQLAKQAKLGSIELRHRARDRAAEIVGDIDVDVVEIEVDHCVGMGHSSVEVLGNHDDRGDSLVAECAFSVGGAHLLEQIGVLIPVDETGHACSKTSLTLDDERYRLPADRD